MLIHPFLDPNRRPGFDAFVGSAGDLRDGKAVFAGGIKAFQLVEDAAPFQKEQVFRETNAASTSRWLVIARGLS